MVVDGLERLLAGRDALQLSGGGLKTLAFCGALEQVDLSRFRIIAGVSGGSVLALAFVLGYKPSEAADLLSDAGLAGALAMSASPVRALAEGALLDQSLMVKELARWMRAKGFPADGTFKDLHRHTGGLSLRVVVCTTGPGTRLWVLDERSTPDEQVLRAVRASIAVPFAFPPVQVAGSLCIDAGLVNNLCLFAAGEDPRRTLGLLAGRDHEESAAPLGRTLPGALLQLAANGFKRMDFLMNAELAAHARTARVVRMPTVPGPDYHIFRLGSNSRADMERLLQQGRDALRAASCAPELASLLCFSASFGLFLPSSKRT